MSPQGSVGIDSCKGACIPPYSYLIRTPNSGPVSCPGWGGTAYTWQWTKHNPCGPDRVAKITSLSVRVKASM
jgi:hypothetical protein